MRPITPIAALAVLLAAGCTSGGGNGSATATITATTTVTVPAGAVTTTPAAPTTTEAGSDPLVHQIVFRLSGSATEANLTLNFGDGNTSQQNNVGVPLKNKQGEVGLHFEAYPGDFLYFSAQNQDSFGTLNCQIVRDGQVIARSHASGAYAIATCSARA
ncbi:MAG: hypothetical protein J2P16_15365 [Mycobacterium sp.]|nr:hypothetical protein [Mycobacterium sp.]